MFGIFITLSIFFIIGIIYLVYSRAIDNFENFISELKTKHPPLLKITDVMAKTYYDGSTLPSYGFIDFVIYKEGILIVNGKYSEFWYYNKEHEEFFKNNSVSCKIEILTLIENNKFKIIGDSQNNKIKLPTGPIKRIIEFNSEIEKVKDALEISDVNYKKSA